MSVLYIHGLGASVYGDLAFATKTCMLAESSASILSRTRAAGRRERGGRRDRSRIVSFTGVRIVRLAKREFKGFK